MSHFRSSHFPFKLFLGSLVVFLGSLVEANSGCQGLGFQLEDPAGRSTVPFRCGLWSKQPSIIPHSHCQGCTPFKCWGPLVWPLPFCFECVRARALWKRGLHMRAVSSIIVEGSAWNFGRKLAFHECHCYFLVLHSFVGSRSWFFQHLIVGFPNGQ